MPFWRAAALMRTIHSRRKSRLRLRRARWAWGCALMTPPFSPLLFVLGPRRPAPPRPRVWRAPRGPCPGRGRRGGRGPLLVGGGGFGGGLLVARPAGLVGARGGLPRGRFRGAEGGRHGGRSFSWGRDPGRRG